MKSIFLLSLFFISLKAFALNSPHLRINQSIIEKGGGVDLSWNAPSGATHYNLWVIKPDGVSANFRSGYTSTSFPRRNINFVGTHTFYIEACSVSQCSRSNSVSLTVVEPPPPVPSPGFLAGLNVSRTNIGYGDSVRISWSAPYNMNGFPVYYDVYVTKPGVAGSPSENFLWFDNTTATSATRTNIYRRGTTQIQVRACNQYNQCGPMSTTSFTVSGELPQPNFSVSNQQINQGESVYLSWSNHIYYNEPVTYSVYDGDVRIANGSDIHSLNYTMNNLGYRYLSIAMCNSYGECSDRTKTRTQIKVLPTIETSVVKALKLDKYEIEYGDSITASWQRPEGYTSDDQLVYDIYITKPSAIATEPDEHFLWKDNLTTNYITRGPIFRRSKTKIEVVPCLITGECGLPMSVTYDLSGDSLPQPIQFKTIADKGYVGFPVSFDIQMPTNFSEAVTNQIWVKYPNTNQYSRFDPSTKLSTRGPHFFQLEVCTVNTPTICNKKQDTEFKLDVTPLVVENLRVDKPTIELNQYVNISWQKPAGISHEFVYDVYITKPSATGSSETETVLWHDNTTDISLNRGPNYRLGKTIVEVVPCTVDQKCGEKTRVEYTVSGGKLPDPDTFSTDKNIYYQGQWPTFSWQLPEFYKETIRPTFWVKKPSTSALVKYDEGTPLNDVGSYTFYLELCDTLPTPTCSNKSNSWVTVSVTDSLAAITVADLQVDKSTIKFGESVNISWRKPQSITAPLTYNVYISKPSTISGEPDETFLWQSNFTGTQLQRGPNYRVGGAIIIEVEPCLQNGSCGSKVSTSYRIHDSQLPNVSFINVPEHFILEQSIFLNWQIHELFKEHATYSLYMREPGSNNLNLLGEFDSNVQALSYKYNLTKAGIYKFYVQACLTGENKNICSNLAASELVLTVKNERFAITLKDKVVSWKAISGAQKIELQRAKCSSKANCNSSIQREWLEIHGIIATATSYTIDDALDGNYIYRGRTCFLENSCTQWSYATDMKEKKIIYIHTDLLGSPIAETQ
ncbi:hypothetical protein [Pseudoalteromonas sp. OF7H-1]|uniref:hypothetical protein n=1 Tax=Pseudoalteromonas sp. OF7H-1 TaxID=2917755 RepID=UPI001EF53CA6|nr:hypothetical protein [Pseudoalteromonas sp. OF7H-1]MCG7540142.1 hypothetical protein [Pseudoalteromonas sp. OF7H-1]